MDRFQEESTTTTPIAAATAAAKNSKKSFRVRFSSAKKGTTATHYKNEEKKNDDQDAMGRLVAVRYFLDRPGYDLNQSSVRFWDDPPCPACSASDIQTFLKKLGIALDDLLVEIHMDQFESYMMLEACIASCVVWDFTDASYADPGILNIRLTDLAHARQELDGSHHRHNNAIRSSNQDDHHHDQPSQHANTVPLGLFAFSMMIGLETAELMGRLIPGTVDVSFVMTWGPYMMMCGGLLQVLSGIFQVFRNNIYGATAFLGYGSFWFSNGLRTVLKTYFSGDIPAQILLESDDPWGTCIRNFFILSFSLVLVMQTFVMNKISTTLMGLVCAKVAVAAFAGWSNALKWAQLGIGWTTAVFAFYVFTVELTNQVYHREVFPVYKWSQKNSPEEVFGAVGRSCNSTLYSKAARLRQASVPTIHAVRSVLPCDALTVVIDKKNV